MAVDVASTTLRTRVLVRGRSTSKHQLHGDMGLVNPKVEPVPEAQENAPLTSCRQPEHDPKESLSSGTNAHPPARHVCE